MTDPAPRRRIDATRARYAREVGAQHVGERVSIRHLVDDPQRGSIPTDVVGRLMSYDDDLLLVVDREKQLHVVDTAGVLASKLIPVHPRLPPEPATPTREQPLVREAARVLLLDRSGRVLLVAHRHTSDEHVWTAPGGGLRPGESHLEAATRELDEEIGLRVELGPCIIRRRFTFAFRALWLEQREQWFLAHTDGYDTASAPLDDAGIDHARWWAIEGLEATGDQLAPATLPTLVRRLIAEGPPAQPWEIDI